MAGQPTAAMLVIGDEILSGRTRDANMFHLAGRLSAHGIDLREVEDRVAVIDGEGHRFGMDLGELGQQRPEAISQQGGRPTVQLQGGERRTRHDEAIGGSLHHPQIGERGHQARCRGAWKSSPSTELADTDGLPGADHGLKQGERPFHRAGRG